MQDGINVQVGKSHKINKLAGWNKAVQVGIFNFLLMQNKVLGTKLPKINKRAGWNKGVQVGILQKNFKVWCTIIR